MKETSFHPTVSFKEQKFKQRWRVEIKDVFVKEEMNA